MCVYIVYYLKPDQLISIAQTYIINIHYQSTTSPVTESAHQKKVVIKTTLKGHSTDFTCQSQLTTHGKYYSTCENSSLEGLFLS